MATGRDERVKNITSLEELQALYGPAVPGALTKVRHSLTPLYKKWVASSRFLVLSTVGPGGTDASPRGDDSEVARIVDARTLWIPDWRGNNRLDSLRNIVEDGRVSLMFMINGSNNVVRINGTATLTGATQATSSFEKQGKTPRSVIVVSIGEVYFQCAKALMRSKLWDSNSDAAEVPSAGAFLKEVHDEFDGDAYDADYPEYAKERMW